MTDWYSIVLDDVRDSLERLASEKAAAPVSSEWERQLKYQLRAFRHGAAIVEDTPPAPGESFAAYAERVTPLLEVVPDHVAVIDRVPWLEGIQRLLWAIHR